MDGTNMMYLALEAYVETQGQAMVHLSIGFALIVAAATWTATAAVFLDFAHVRPILLANSGFTVVGYLFIVYSLRSYGKSESPATHVSGVEYPSSRAGGFYP